MAVFMVAVTTTALELIESLNSCVSAAAAAGENRRGWLILKRGRRKGLRSAKYELP